MKSSRSTSRAGAGVGPVGNVYDKYGSRNPVARRLMDGFLASVGRFYLSADPDRVLEVGCGEGKLAGELARLHEPAFFAACDISLERLAPDADHRIHWFEASAYELPFADRSFDLVVCCEVIEHLDHPTEALREIARVSRRRVLISTPREPLWRFLNIARGKYLSRLGNTPGHVGHFSSRRLRDLASTELLVEALEKPLPWTVILGEVR